MQKYKVEIILIVLASLIVAVSIIIYLKATQSINTNQEISDQSSTNVLPNWKILVDISGAVVKPDVYEVTAGARLKNLLSLAGGLSPDADKNFFSRNYNLARIVNDQEKIYIPYTWETYYGIFVENKRTLDYTQATTLAEMNPAVNSIQLSSDESDKIDINIATEAELDQLPGIGKVTAQKIITNRPYSSVDDLINKKVVSNSVYEKIKAMIVLNQ